MARTPEIPRTVQRFVCRLCSRPGGTLESLRPARGYVHKACADRVGGKARVIEATWRKDLADAHAAKTTAAEASLLTP